MSKYTTSLKNIIFMVTEGEEYPSIYDRIFAATSKIFDFVYPFYDDLKRKSFEQKLLCYYFNKEIGFETFGLWKFYLQSTLSQIMPYYNQLYKSVDVEYNFLNDINLTETYTKSGEFTENNTGINNNTLTNEFSENGSITNTQLNSAENTNTTTGNTKNTGTSTDNTTVTTENNVKNTTTQTTNTSGTNKTLNSDLPQANYNNLDYGTNLSEQTTSNNTTASTDNAVTGTITNTTVGTKTNENTITSTDTTTTKINDTVTNNGETVNTGNNKTIGANNSENKKTGNNTENYTLTKTGTTGSRSYSDLINEYRQAIINIDMEIIKSNEISDLFMKIY